MIDVALRVHLRPEIAERCIHLGEGIGDRGPGREDEAATVTLFLNVANLQEHIECSVAVGVR